MTSTTPYKVLAVCLGNICRSPLAEGLIQRKADEAGLNWQVASAGTGNWHVGNPPDPRSRAVAKENGLEISHQRAQTVTSTLMEEYDLILAMDRQNLTDLKSRATEKQARKIKLLLDYTGLSDAHGPDVFDPYWDDSGFEGVYRLLEEAAVKVVKLEANT